MKKYNAGSLMIVKITAGRVPVFSRNDGVLSLVGMFELNSNDLVVLLGKWKTSDKNGVFVLTSNGVG